jgi:RHS repeat-associated protein
MLQGGNIYRIISDQLGSVRLVVNITDSSDVLFAANYSAFGIQEVLVGVSEVVPFGFAGGMFDEATGLVRFGARDYDPVVGRWTAKDPVRFEGRQTNLYLYARGDPMNRLDPTGLYGTNDCSYYAERCEENGGSYYCEDGICQWV